MTLRLGLIVLAVGFTGCAEGDHFFRDVGVAHSGTYAERLEAQQQQIDAERSRTAALDAQNRQLEQETGSLQAAVDREQRDLATLRASIERIDADIHSRQVATAEAGTKRDELAQQLAGIRREITFYEQLLDGTRTTPELEWHKARIAELEKRCAELRDEVLRGITP